MWICSRCQTANKEGYTQCVQCSAPRNARRFGTGTPVSAPSVQAAGTERRMQPPEEAPPAPAPLRRPAQELPKKARRAPGAFVRLIGILLCVLMPLLVLLLAMFQEAGLRPALSGLFLKTVPPPAAFLTWLVYALFILCAVLLSLTPGLALWALGHLSRGIRRKN